MAASDRAGVCLFLRSDGAPTSQGAGLRLDKERGSMAIITPRTCGGFAESGRLEAGILSFEILPSPLVSASPSSVLGESNASVPTTLWASSLDGQPLATSSRILVVHLTDVQGEGARYADASRTILLKWGKAPFIETGSANVTMQLEPRGEAGFTVFALDMAGNRKAEIPAEYRDGTLRFTVSTSGPQGGRIFYEIIRKRLAAAGAPIAPFAPPAQPIPAIRSGLSYPAFFLSVPSPSIISALGESNSCNRTGDFPQPH
jgi:hypothetical protein